MKTVTRALVVRSVDYKDSDKILTLLTPDMGKLSAGARGCRKKGSAIAAACQLLCWSELVLSDRGGKWSVSEASTLREFLGVRRDLDKLALACYFAEMAEVLSVEGMPSPGLLSLTLNSLHALECLDRPPEQIKAVFELKAMCLAGRAAPCAGRRIQNRRGSICGRACSAAPAAGRAATAGSP